MPDRNEQLRKMIEAEPDDPFLSYSLGQEFAKQDEPERAIEYYDRAIQLDPDYCYAYFHKARVQEEQGEIDHARQTLRDGLHRARRTGDEKAQAELAAFLDFLE